MDVKEAVAIAKRYVETLYAEEQLSNLGLEETEFDEQRGQWHITLGFSRPWNALRRTSQRVLDDMNGYSPLKRTFKVLTISGNGSVVSMKSRISEEAAE